MKLRSDMNARTAMVYGGAAFLLMIVGFRSIIATLDPDHVGIMTYLSIGAIVLELNWVCGEIVFGILSCSTFPSVST